MLKVDDSPAFEPKTALSNGMRPEDSNPDHRLRRPRSSTELPAQPFHSSRENYVAAPHAVCTRGGGSSVGRAPGRGPGGRGFESRPPPFALPGPVAQRTSAAFEAARGGSTPPGPPLQPRELEVVRDRSEERRGGELGGLDLERELVQLLPCGIRDRRRSTRRRRSGPSPRRARPAHGERHGLRRRDLRALVRCEGVGEDGPDRGKTLRRDHVLSTTARPRPPPAPAG